MYNINKSFYKTRVLFDVDFNLIEREIHGIVGQNGAGKSTLIKILNGVHNRDSGRIIIDGENIEEKVVNPKKYGISTVFQELSLIPQMTVSENVFLCNEPKRGILINESYAQKQTKAMLDELNIELNISPKVKVGNLDMGSCQIVEIVKCLSQKSNILIFDEPTASLTYKETEVLFKIMKILKNKGVSIILISHYLDDILKISDRVTVLRDGKKVLTDYIENINLDNIVNKIVGKSITMNSKRKKMNQSLIPLLEIDYLKDDSNNKLKDIKFTVHKGEIVGIAGLLGSGKTEILNAIYGIDRKCKKLLKLEGKEIEVNNVNDARKNGIALVPEDRKKQALITNFSIKDNILLPILDKLTNFFFFINYTNGNKIVNNLVKKMHIKTENIRKSVKSLSGGNQQKVAIAKTMVDSFRILLLDDPSSGIDIDSKNDIFKTIYDIAESGNGVILVSSEMSELIEKCDRILILKDGSITEEIDYSRMKKISEEELLKLL